MVEVNVIADYGEMVNIGHLSNRGRGRGSKRGGRTSSRGRGIIGGALNPMTPVYAKCDDQLREDLWESLRTLSDSYNLPWLVTGDFNCIINPVEKKGGSPHRMSKSLSFIQCIIDCELLDVGYTGSDFTWYIGWCPNKRVWQRLDRVLINHDWLNLFDSTQVSHLIRTGADHSPLLITMKSKMRDPKKYFRFLDFWIEEIDFISVVEQAWNVDVQGSPLWKFHL
ncbi:uncharacterized protein [Nicotiana tomentosiformis]|uniref:uncharacterized protein n=1 Tax=Nicotiana tomentosiformis TaxID=4098 RepID=UPI00388C5D00